ncbi:RNA binding protein, heterogenous nuclear RNP-K like protein [Rhizina undulata]
MSKESDKNHEYIAAGAGEDTSLFESSFQNLNVADDRLDEEHEGERTEEDYAQFQLTIRAIVSSKEAGVIIGKAGKNVADLRDETGVKAGVSKVVPGVHDRVLTVTGALEGVARAYAMVAQTLLDSPPSTLTPVSGNNPIRLLISHNQMGTIIGRQGLKIKHIQEVSNARMIAQKDMLPQSTERIVDLYGDANAIRTAVWEIGKCLIDDWQRGTGTILYNPAVVGVGSGGIAGSNGLGGPTGQERYGRERTTRSYARTGNGADFSDASPPYRRNDNPPRSSDRVSPSASSAKPIINEDGEEIQTQNISIPADMVGCIIGRGGTQIQEIRRSSGARISIAKAAHDDTGERMFTIMGSAASNEKALYLLYERLEGEKLRRSQGGSGKD